MECKKPTKKYPNGRTGTYAGVAAHKRAGEERCAECAKSQSEYHRAYLEANAEKKREYNRRWREANAEKKRESDRRWRERNQERAREYERRRYREDREREIEYRRRYRRENRGKIREHNRKRRALKIGLLSENYSPEDITRAHGKKCYLCEGEVDLDLPRGSSLSPQIDHVHPLSREGCPGDVVSNVRWTHAICNIKKGDKLVTDLPLPFVAPVGDEWNLLQ